MNEELWQEFAPIAKRAAKRAWYMSGEHLDLDDLEAEAWYWLMRKREEYASWRDDEGNLYSSSVVQNLTSKHLSRYVRRELMYAAGQDPRDQLNYTRSTVIAALPLALTRVGEQVPNETGIVGSRVANRTGDAQAMALDVRMAYERVASGSQRALFARYGLGLPWAEIGASEGVTDSAVRARADEGIDLIVDILNGLYPVKGHGPGTRRVMSNAAAQAVTERGGEPPDGINNIMA